MNLYDKDIISNFRRVNNIITLLRIIRNIERKIGRTLLENEKASVRQILNNTTQVSRSYRIDPTRKFFIQNLQKYNDNKIIENISNKWIYSHYI